MNGTFSEELSSLYASAQACEPMVKNYNTIRLASLIVFALCAAMCASSDDLAFRAKSHRSHAFAKMHWEGDEWADFALGSSSIPPALHLRTTGAGHPGASLDAAISSAGVVSPVAVWGQFQAFPSHSLQAAASLAVPSDRAPPIV
jgi:hypothetical protein